MTISSSTNKNLYNGDGSTTVFPYTFKILAGTDVQVQVENAAGDVATKVLTTDYTVSGVGEDSGGNITFLSAPAASEVISFIRNVSATQETDYVENDTFPAETHEAALDKLTMLYQQGQEVSSRSLTYKSTISDTVSTTMPVAADKYIKWNSAGTELETSSIADGTSLSLPVAVTEGGTGTVTGDFSLIAGAERTIEVGPNATGDGDDLNVNAGNAAVGFTDKDGGNLDLGAGDATGSGTSNVRLMVAGGGSTGTSASTAFTTAIYSPGQFSWRPFGTEVVDFNQASTASEAAIRLFPWGTSSGQTTKLTFLELASNGTNFLSLRAPDSITTSVSYTLPPADGSPGHVLSTNGSGVLTFANPSSALATYSLEADVTASNSATVDFTGLANTFSEYKLVLRNVLVQTDGAILLIRLYGGGSILTAVDDYSYHVQELVHDTSETVTSNGDDSHSSIIMARDCSSTSTELVNAEITIFAPNAGGRAGVAFTTNFTNSSSQGTTGFGGGRVRDTTNLDGIRVYANSGNIVSGDFYLYGVKNA